MADLLNRLRTETADCHRALENALDMMRPSLSRREYIALLAAFRGFVGPWEAALEAAVPAEWQPFVRARHKAALLEADLAFLLSIHRDDHAAGLRNDAAPGAQRSAPPALPPAMRAEIAPEVLGRLLPLDSLGRAFGSMYVMEGSTLGGRMIGPVMANRFGLSEHRGYAYFDPYRERTGSMWNTFKETAAQGVPVDQYDAAVRSAQQTFAVLQQWLVPTAHGAAR